MCSSLYGLHCNACDLHAHSLLAVSRVCVFLVSGRAGASSSLSWPTMNGNEEEDEDSIGHRSPINIVPVVGSVAARTRPPFISNRQFVTSLAVFGTFAWLVFVVQWLAMRIPYLGFIGAVVVLVFMGEWERRARFSFGRVRMRAYFDPLNMVTLPTPQFRSDIEIEPPTPYIPQTEKMRSDPAAILKRAQDTISDGGHEGGAQSTMELALVGLLKQASIKWRNGEIKPASKKP